MMVEYGAWYMDAISRNGEMDREFYGSLATTLRFAIKDNQDGAVIGVEKLGKYGEVLDYPVFGTIFKTFDRLGKIHWVYKGKKTPTSRVMAYSVSKNGALAPIRRN